MSVPGSPRTGLAVGSAAVSSPSSGGPAVPVPVAAGAPGAVVRPSLPPVPPSVTVAAAAPPPAPPLAGKAPELLGPAAPRAGADPLPSRALERAAAEDAAREAERGRRDAAALREREAEAGVLTQFLRRVLRLEPAAEPSPEPVSGGAR